MNCIHLAQNDNIASVVVRPSILVRKNLPCRWKKKRKCYQLDLFMI